MSHCLWVLHGAFLCNNCLFGIQWSQDLVPVLNGFDSFKALTGRAESLMRFVRHCEHLLEPDARVELNTVFAKLSAVQATDLVTTPLKAVEEHLASLSGIDERVVFLDPLLQTTLVQGQHLFEWMRQSLSNDEAFRNNIEIINGLSEMECPEELWEDLNSKLAALASVRQTLAVFIYRKTDLFSCTRDLIDCVSRVEGVDQTILEHVSGRPCLIDFCSAQCSF